jgi:hypothetical protein
MSTGPRDFTKIEPFQISTCQTKSDCPMSKTKGYHMLMCPGLDDCAKYVAISRVAAYHMQRLDDIAEYGPEDE